MSVRRFRLLSPALLGLAVTLATAPLAQEGQKKEEFPPFDKVVDGLTKLVTATDGPTPLYELWADKKAGRLVAVLPSSFENQELMIACTVTSGHPEAGVMGPTFYGSWKRIGKQLAFVVPELSVRTDGDAHSKAAVANLYTDRLLVTTPILTLVDGSRPAIDLGQIATKEAPKLFSGQGGYGPSLQGLQASLATISKAKAFPKNVVIEFEAPQADGRLMRVAYSIGTLEGTPGYEPRKADARVGFFYDWYSDTTPGEFDRQPERFITRWNVAKADPKLSLSPPKQPIVWYIEHTTPIKYRRYVREGIELWNEAFQKVGIVGALEVYQQDATTGAHMEKDPEDARYNFFRWNMSDATYAIGPSRSNPRTGEILDADVVWNQGLTRAVGSMLGSLSKGLIEQSSSPELLRWYDANPRWDPRARLEGLFGEAEQDGPAESANEALGLLQSACHMGTQLSVDLSLVGAAFEAGLIEMDSESELDGVPEEFLGPMIRYIAAHEVGHCLGLQHNMAASSLVPLTAMNQPGYEGVVTASVMDYVAPNLAEPGTKQEGPFINAHLGPYDVWAIACGYGPADKTAETLALSTKPEHTYVSQAAMSFGSDPRNQTWDVGANNLDFCEARMRLVGELRAKLTQDLVKDGEPWAMARRRYQQLMGTHLRSLVIASAWIGGSYESQDVKGSEGARPPIEDVSAADQRRALAFLTKNTFEDAAFGLTPEMVRHMGKEYWWDPAGMTELTQESSYTVHDFVGGVQAMGLSLLMNPTRLRRVHDNEFRRAQGEDAFTLAELLTSVTDSIWSECKTASSGAGNGKPVCSSFRRNLQWEHAGRLIDLVLTEDAPSPALRAITTLAASELRRIDSMAKEAEGRPLDPATKAHFSELRTRIGKALDAAYVKKG